MRRERDDESGDARHDGAGQRYGGRCNPRRIISIIAVGLLTASREAPIIKPYLMVQPTV
jgi:hypothetical protein